MTITYVFENLTALADHLDVKAQEAMERNRSYLPKAHREHFAHGESAALSQVASMIRSCKLRNPEADKWEGL